MRPVSGQGLEKSQKSGAIIGRAFDPGLNTQVLQITHTARRDSIMHLQQVGRW